MDKLIKKHNRPNRKIKKLNADIKELEKEIKEISENTKDKKVEYEKTIQKGKKITRKEEVK